MKLNNYESYAHTLARIIEHDCKKGKKLLKKREKVLKINNV